MGNVQAYGQFESGNLNNTDSINSKKEEQTLFMKLLEEKKKEMQKLLEMYLYHINLAVLEHSFKLKNEELLDKMNNELKDQEEAIKKNENKYTSKMRDLKYISKQNEQKKYINLIMFYLTLISIVALTSLIVYSIYIK
tara:strand:- start:464 stop:877 length:414 start_codon:yes stop_codon:yes gene_type:complete